MSSRREFGHHPTSSAPTHLADDLDDQNNDESSMFFDFDAWDGEMPGGMTFDHLDLAGDLKQHLGHDQAAPEPPHSPTPWIEPGLSPYADSMLCGPSAIDNTSSLGLDNGISDIDASHAQFMSPANISHGGTHHRGSSQEISNSISTSTKRKRARISEEAKTILVQHFSRNPYPSDLEIWELATNTKHTMKEVKTWFGNRRSRFGTGKTSLAALERSSSAESLISLERYLALPASEDSVPMETVLAIEAGLGAEPQTSRSNSEDQYNFTRRSRRRSASTARSSAKSFDSCSSRGSGATQQSFRSLDSRGSRRGRKLWVRSRQEDLFDFIKTGWDGSLFCTWPGCNEKFKFRWAWSRHEEAVHYQPYHWICCLDEAPDAPIAECFICGRLNTTIGHIKEEHFALCIGKDVTARTFLRKDHLVQHIKRMHHIEQISAPGGGRTLLSRWEVPNLETKQSSLHCGFCGDTLATWKERQDHVHAHMIRGTTKSCWIPGRSPLAAHDATEADDTLMSSSLSPCPTWSCSFLDDYRAAFITSASGRDVIMSACALCDVVLTSDNVDDHAIMLRDHATLHEIVGTCNWGPTSDIYDFTNHLRTAHGATIKVSRAPHQVFNSWSRMEVLDLDSIEQVTETLAGLVGATAECPLQDDYPGLLTREEEDEYINSLNSTNPMSSKLGTWWNWMIGQDEDED